MGCGGSKEQGPGDGSARPARPAQPARPLQTISAPQGGLQMVPTPRRDPSGLPIRHREFDINRSNLLTALGHMASYLQSQRADITIVAVGGAVNTIFLRSREVTRDVDFFGASQQARLIRDASKHAQQQSAIQLGANWLNNSTTLFIPQALQTQLVQAAIQQNVVIFRAHGLTVLAAPWNYALCGKTNRMSGPDQRSYDCADAVQYLREHIRLHGGPVRARDIEAWGNNFGKVVTTEALHQIHDMYRHMYQSNGITFT